MSTNDPRPNQPEPDDRDPELENALRAVLHAPARPMTFAQIDQVVRSAARRQPAIPLWALIIWGIGLAGMALAGTFLTGLPDPVRTLAVLLPAVNLAAAPIASLAIILRRRKHYVKQA